MKSTLLLVTLLLLFSLSALAQTDRGAAIDLYNTGDYQEAVEKLAKLAKESDKDNDLSLYIGLAYAKLGKHKEAVETLRWAADNKIMNLVGMDTPLKVLKKPRASYTDDARQNRVQGFVRLAVEMGADGKVTFVYPFERLEHGLTNQAENAAKRIKFEPAIKNGKPVSTISIYSYGFTIYHTSAQSHKGPEQRERGQKLLF